MKPIPLTPRAARWLHALIHTPGLGVKVEDLEAALEAISPIDAAVKELEASGAAAAGNGQAASRGAGQ